MLFLKSSRWQHPAASLFQTPSRVRGLIKTIPMTKSLGAGTSKVGSQGLRVRLLHSHVPRRCMYRTEELRIKQLVKKFFKTYSFTRVRSVVDHPDYFDEFEEYTDGVVMTDDNRYMPVHGKTSKRYPIFSSSRFWNDSKEEPLRFDKGKLLDSGYSTILQSVQPGYALPNYVVINWDTVFCYPRGGILSDDPDKRITHKLPRYDNYGHSKVDHRNPKRPQLWGNILGYITAAANWLAYLRFGYTAQDVTLHVLVAKGVECFSLESDGFIAIGKGDKDSLFKNNVYLIDKSSVPKYVPPAPPKPSPALPPPREWWHYEPEPKPRKTNKEWEREWSREVEAPPQKPSELKGITPKGMFIATEKHYIASDISINNEFTCIRHSSAHKIFFAAAIDHDTGQNYLFSGSYTMASSCVDPPFKILEIQSLQVTSRTTPIRLMKMLPPNDDCALAVLCETRQLHVCYYLKALKQFGFLQFNVPVGSDGAEAYRLDLLGKEDIAVSGRNLLQLFRMKVKLH